MGVPFLSYLPPTARSIVREVREANVSLLAASIAAYSAFVSLLPLIAFLLFVSLAIGRETLSERVLELTEGMLAPAAQRVLADALANASA